MTAEKSNEVPAMFERLFVDALGFERVEFAAADDQCADGDIELVSVDAESVHTKAAG